MWIREWIAQRQEAERQDELFKQRQDELFKHWREHFVAHEQWLAAAKAGATTRTVCWRPLSHAPDCECATL